MGKPGTILSLGRPLGRWNETLCAARPSPTEHAKMLILSRKLNEQIVVGDQIRITVVAIRSGYVRLGVEAPADVSVHRKEVYDSLHEKPQDERPVRQKADPPGG
jgi:carbon storage regulator